MSTTLAPATPDDVALIFRFLDEMREELGELAFDKETVIASVTRSFNENVFWFLFFDEKNVPFGVCHLQSVYNYWRLKKRYYLGGLYIAPAFRGQGRFREIYKGLRCWAEKNDGVQIYAHIHEQNEKSLRAFQAVGFKTYEHQLYIDHWQD